MAFSSDERNDLIEATNALSLTTASLERRIVTQDEELHRIKAERKAGIDSLVAQLLPDLRLATFNRLVAAAPRFVDAEVQYLMHRRWYTLFIFKRTGYDQTLTTLRTRMAFAAGKGLLPQIVDRVADWNSSIDTLQAERAEMAVRQRDVLASLELLRAAAGNRVELPPQAKKDVQLIVQRARVARQTAQAAQATRAAGGAQNHFLHDAGNSQTVYVDNVDVWSGFAADVPQSFTGMAFEAMRQSHQANPMNDGGGIDFADPPASPAGDIDFGDGPAAAQASGKNDIDFADDGANTGRAAIATDDRLGAFS